MTAQMHPIRLLRTETTRPPAGREVQMPSTTAPRVGPPPHPHQHAPHQHAPHQHAPQHLPPRPTATSAPAQAGPPTSESAPIPATPGHPGSNGQAVAFPRQRPRADGPEPASPPAPPAQPTPPEDAAAAEALPDDVDGAHTAAWSLVKASQAGDMNAFSELFDRYHDVVFRYVLFRMGDRNLAEDITQETFLRALRRISSVNYQGKDIGAWFVTIARNLIFDHVKSSRYRLESPTAEFVELSLSTGGPEQQVLDGATNDELLSCVRKLNPDQQECIQLRFLQGLSVAETARIMHRNEGAVKALQHRAVRRLGQLLPEGIR
jgi:RNA polymerase sigma-70 factor (ECF subfamily)